MEIICENDCRACFKMDCPQRRCPPIPTISTPDRKILREENPPNFDWKEDAKPNLSE